MRKNGESPRPQSRDIRPVSYDTRFRVLDHDPHIPELDLHDMSTRDAENQIFDFLRDQHEKNIRSVRIVFGRGGTGALRREVERILAEDKKRAPELRFVEDYSFSTANQAGSILVIMGD